MERDVALKRQAKEGAGVDEAPVRLMIFGVTKLSDMLRKGHLGYVDGCRDYFSAVDCVYLAGNAESFIEAAQVTAR